MGKKARLHKILSVCLILCMMLSQTWIVNAQESLTEAVHINVVDYGADPDGKEDSADAIWKALEAAKTAEAGGTVPVVLDFPKGEYHIYKDHAQVREYHTSNTNSIQNPQKTIGILIEGHKNLTINGNGSLFMMHGNMMALAVVESENIVLQDFSWDFGVPTVSEMTIMDMGTENGKPFTDFYVPACCPYEINGTSIRWVSEKSPYTGEYYWTQNGIHNNAYSVVAYVPKEEMTRLYYTSDSPFTGASSIKEMGDGVLRITYGSARPSMQQIGMVLEFADSGVRETAGAFTWESSNVTANRVNVHFMHGFGWLIQMSANVEYHECNFMPRENSGHITVSFADAIHASGAAGKIVIDGCNFSNSHDDPINLHGTFTRVEQRVDDNTLVLKYIHTQQGGFPQFHEGDKVAFFTRNTLESTDNETFYTVDQVISNPGENGNDLRTMRIRFKETLPSNLSDKISGEPKYVAENVTYAPEVTITNNTFKNIPTRGILCTTRNKVLIENNTFLNMSMATIYLSNDSDQWYESGPIRDMTIRNNTFYIKSIGRTSWEYAPAVYIHPVTKGGGLPSKDNPIHKNITIEGNTFHMDVDTVVKAESVENLTIRNNKILRTDPEIEIKLEPGVGQMKPEESFTLTTTVSGDTHTRDQDNVFEFTKCKNVGIEGNTYDDGLKKYAVLSGMSAGDVTNKDADIQFTESRSEAAAAPAEDLRYASSDPEIVSVDGAGTVTAKKAGKASVYAYYVWNGTIIKSNVVEVTVAGTPDTLASARAAEAQGDNDLRLDELSVNGWNLFEDSSVRFAEVLIPADLKKIELRYHSSMADEGETEVALNGQSIDKDAENTDVLVLEVKDNDVISVKRDSSLVYEIKIKTVESNAIAVSRIEMPGIGFSSTDFSEGNGWCCTKTARSTLRIVTDGAVGKVEVLDGAYRRPLAMQESNGTYVARAAFAEGMNSYYVRVTAKDGITIKQYIMNVLFQRGASQEEPDRLADLWAAMEEAGAYRDKKDEYTEESAQALENALAAAVGMTEQNSDEEIAAAAKAVRDAVANLEKKPEKDPGEDPGKNPEEKPPAEKKLPYTDVQKSDWFYNYVYDAYQKKLMTGLSGTLFGPGQTLVRAQFATILYRIEGKPEIKYSSRFKDVGTGQFYTEPVLWAASVKVVTGYSSGDFGPNDQITREQMALMMYRYADYKGYDVRARQSLNAFPDADQVSDYAQKAMEWCVAKGIISGQGDGVKRLNPQGATSRAECATIISRYVNVYGSK